MRMTKQRLPRGSILSIAGSDSGGGAGIQADIKTITALGGYASTAITALTAQNTTGVQGIYQVPAEFIRQQIKSVIDDIGVDSIKTGMLGDSEIIKAVAAAIPKNIPLVVDPVMVAKGGAVLLQREAISALQKQLLPKALLMTPNIPEAQILLGRTIATVEEMKQAGQDLLGFGMQSVLVKGGHLSGSEVYDVFVCKNKPIHIFTSKRLVSQHTHGTGCTLSAAIAAGLAQKYDLISAIQRARSFVWNAIKCAPGLGKGHGPLNHLITINSFD